MENRKSVSYVDELETCSKRNMDINKKKKEKKKKEDWQKERKKRRLSDFESWMKMRS